MDPVPLNDNPSHHCLPSWWSRTWLVGGGHLVSSILLCGCQLYLLAACHSIDSSPPPQANSMCLCFWLTGVLVGPPLSSVESNPGKKKKPSPKNPGQSCSQLLRKRGVEKTQVRLNNDALHCISEVFCVLKLPPAFPCEWQSKAFLAAHRESINSVPFHIQLIMH